MLKKAGPGHARLSPGRGRAARRLRPGGGKVSDLADVVWDGTRPTSTRILTLLATGRYDEVTSVADSLEEADGTDPRLKGQKAEALWRTRDVLRGRPSSTFVEDYAVCETHLNFAVPPDRQDRARAHGAQRGKDVLRRGEHTRYKQEPCCRRRAAMKALRWAAGHEGLDYAPKDSYLLGLKGMLIAETNPVLAETLFVRSDAAGGSTTDFLGHQLGLLMLRSSEPARAVRPLEEALAADPADREKMSNYAEALSKIGQDEGRRGCPEKDARRSVRREGGGAARPPPFCDERFTGARTLSGPCPRRRRTSTA